VLPQTLQRLEVRGANFVGDHLEIAFGRPPGAEAAEAGGRKRA
jgi:hypothetical protein